MLSAAVQRGTLTLRATLQRAMCTAPSPAAESRSDELERARTAVARSSRRDRAAVPSGPPPAASSLPRVFGPIPRWRLPSSRHRDTLLRSRIVVPVSEAIARGNARGGRHDLFFPRAVPDPTLAADGSQDTRIAAELYERGALGEAHGAAGGGGGGGGGGGVVGAARAAETMWSSSDAGRAASRAADAEEARARASIVDPEDPGARTEGGAFAPGDGLVFDLALLSREVFRANGGTSSSAIARPSSSSDAAAEASAAGASVDPATDGFLVSDFLDPRRVADPFDGKPVLPRRTLSRARSQSVSVQRRRSHRERIAGEARSVERRDAKRAKRWAAFARAKENTGDWDSVTGVTRRKVKARERGEAVFSSI